jgi:signal transduction histidine kinase
VHSTPEEQSLGLASPRQLRRLLDAVVTVGSDLDLSVVLTRIAETATELSGATFGALGVLDESRSFLSEFITVGIDAAVRERIGDLPHGHGILGLLITDPRPIRLPDLSEHPDSCGFPPNHPAMTSFLGVPVQIRGEAFGNLYLCNKVGGDVFTDVDQELVVALATAAGVAIENARLLRRVADVALLEDRDRIARDLHDSVIQRLFAIGLSLEGVARLSTDPRAIGRIDSAVDELDTTIKEIRSTIFELHSVRPGGISTRQASIALAAEAAHTLGYEPTIYFDGPIDTAVGDTLAEHVLAVQREALSNVARHAGASAVDVRLVALDAQLRLEVTDDGVGVDSSSSGGRGLHNLRSRAMDLGGECTIERLAEGGTRLRWSAPLR